MCTLSVVLNHVMMMSLFTSRSYCRNCGTIARFMRRSCSPNSEVNSSLVSLVCPDNKKIET